MIRSDLLPLRGAREPRNVAATWETRVDSTNRDEVVLAGYASVVESPYEMYGGPDAGGWTEVVDSKAFDKTLRSKPQVHFLANHGGLPLASTINKTLSLSADGTGLAVEARLQRKYPSAMEIVNMVSDGLLSEMSFAFRTIRDRWFNDAGEEVEWGTGTQRRLTELSIDKGDVSVVNFGANPATSIGLRAAVEMISAASLEDLAKARAELVDARAWQSAQTNLGRALTVKKTGQRRGMSVQEAESVISHRIPLI